MAPNDQLSPSPESRAGIIQGKTIPPHLLEERLERPHSSMNYTSSSRDWSVHWLSSLNQWNFASQRAVYQSGTSILWLIGSLRARSYYSVKWSLFHQHRSLKHKWMNWSRLAFSGRETRWKVRSSKSIKLNVPNSVAPGAYTSLRLKLCRGARLPFLPRLWKLIGGTLEWPGSLMVLHVPPSHHERSNSSFLRLHMKRLDERSRAERQKRQTGWYATVLPSPFSNGSTSSFVSSLERLSC